MDIPDEIIQRLLGVEKGKQAEEGIKICIESI
jgi:methylenetetrahydrofolate reductase (NADPH)